MVIEVIDNQGVTSMSAELSNNLESCSTARLATASLTKEGLAAIENALSVERRLKVKLLVGLYNGHTEAAALRKLLTLQKRASGSLEVKVAQNPRFHWKVYLFHSGGRVAAYVGSSNLTGDGLGAEGEFNLQLSGARRDRAVRNIAETFDRIWHRHSVPLTAEISDNFAPVSERSRQLTQEIDPKIRKLLRRVRHAKPSKPKRETDHVPVFTFLDDIVERSTRRELRSKTNWDVKGWYWAVFHTRADRDRLLNAGSFYLVEAYRKGGTISLNDVCDEDEFGTEDGSFFIAYQKRRGSVARATNNRTLKILKDGGFIARKSDLFRDRRVAKKDRDLLNQLLKVSN